MNIALVPFCSVSASQPDSEGLNRLNKALELIRDGKIQKIMISGGHRKSVDLSTIYHTYLLTNGATEDQLWIEGQSSTTLTNVENSGQVIAGKEAEGEKIGTVYIISGPIHLHRIKLLISHYRHKQHAWPWPVKFVKVRSVYNKKINYTWFNEITKTVATILDPEQKSKKARIFQEQRMNSDY